MMSSIGQVNSSIIGWSKIIEGSSGAPIPCVVSEASNLQHASVALVTNCATSVLTSSLRGMLLLDFLYAPNLSIDKPYLDPMWVRNGVGQNILDDPSG
jgi:hypothetical protein